MLLFKKNPPPPEMWGIGIITRFWLHLILPIGNIIHYTLFRSQLAHRLRKTYYIC